MNERPIKVSEIKRISQYRPQGYYEEIMASGREVNGILYIPTEKYLELKRKYTQSEVTGSNKMRGLGDAVAKVAQPIARVIDRVAGTNVQGCGGCKKRQEFLNKVVPFGN